MNSKCFADEALPISILSHFHRGFFWGITISWLAGISVAMGATITKSAYLDRQNYQLASHADFQLASDNGSIQQSINRLNPDTSNSENNSTTVKVKKSKLSFPRISLFQSKIASFLNQNYSETNFSALRQNNAPSKLTSNQKKEQNKHLEQQSSPSSNIIKEAQNLESESHDYLSSNNEGSQQLIYIVDSQSQHTSLEQFSSINAIRNFKQSKIVIRNLTKNSELAEYISAYLQERDFLNIAIANVEINDGQTSQQEQTIIRTNGQNLKSATYLRNILGFGDLELLPSGFLNPSDSSELVILLGSDAQVFSQNQDFVSFIR